MSNPTCRPHHVWPVLLVVSSLLTGCTLPTVAQFEVVSSDYTAQEARAQSFACKRAVGARPEFAQLLPHLPDPVTGRFNSAQLTDETWPTAQEAALFASWSDATDACNRTYIMAAQSVRPDVAAILNNWQTARSQVATQLVERRITWAEFARQSQRLLSAANAQITASSQRWMVEKNAENQAELKSRNAMQSGPGGN